MANLIALKRNDFKKALDSLHEVLEMEYTDIIRDSALLRFELVSELAWKTLKILLRERYDVESPYASTVYRESLKINMLTDEEVVLALQMVKDRNRMVHDYNSSYAQELFIRVKKQYYLLLENIYNKTA